MLLEPFEGGGAGVGGDAGVVEVGVELGEFGDDGGIGVADILCGADGGFDGAVRIGQRRAEGRYGEIGLRAGLGEQV